jgi:small subunit ribosomal protein S21
LVERRARGASRQSETLLQTPKTWKFAAAESAAFRSFATQRELKCDIRIWTIGQIWLREASHKCDNLYSARKSAGWGVMTMAEIRLQEGESLENALRRFKRKVQTEDIIKEVKRHSYYLKPGERKRVKQALAQKRARKKIRKERD